MKEFKYAVDITSKYGTNRVGITAHAPAEALDMALAALDYEGGTDIRFEVSGHRSGYTFLSGNMIIPEKEEEQEPIWYSVELAWAEIFEGIKIAHIAEIEKIMATDEQDAFQKAIIELEERNLIIPDEVIINSAEVINMETGEVFSVTPEE